jgi:hypothetical protein
MAGTSANVSSIDALAAVKAALLRFQTDVASALVTLEIEGRRPQEWIEQDRARYWPAQMRKASDDLNSARINLERCELAIRPDDKRSCYDEKKAFENAKRRLRLCEEKVQLVRQWRVKIQKEVEEFLVQVSKLQWYMESDYLRGVAQLERMIASLERYVQSTAPPADESKGGARADL